MPKVHLRLLADELPEEGVEDAGVRAYRTGAGMAANPYPYMCSDWLRWQAGYDIAESQDLLSDLADLGGDFGVVAPMPNKCRRFLES